MEEKSKCKLVCNCPNKYTVFGIPPHPVKSLGWAMVCGECKCFRYVTELKLRRKNKTLYLSSPPKAYI